jgi:hypothetical protein
MLPVQFTLVVYRAVNAKCIHKTGGNAGEGLLEKQMYNSSKLGQRHFSTKTRGLRVRVVRVELGKAQGCSAIAAAKRAAVVKC